MREKVKELLERLDERIDQVQSSEEFKEILKTFSQFHNYSFQNSLLIKIQKPEATKVAGYRQWQKKFNRNVKKGEEGISIIAPFSLKIEVEEEGENKTKEITKTYFRKVYVFDVTQTEGDPLPIVDTELADTFEKLIEPLLSYLEEKGLKLQFENMKKNVEGYFNGESIVVNNNLNNTEKASVIVHEIAHVILHRNNKGRQLNKEIKEMEAEATAFVVMQNFGIETKSDNYLALYKKSYNLKESLTRINKVASEIIIFCEDYFKKADI